MGSYHNRSLIYIYIYIHTLNSPPAVSFSVDEVWFGHAAHPPELVKGIRSRWRRLLSLTCMPV